MRRIATTTALMLVISLAAVITIPVPPASAQIVYGCHLNFISKLLDALACAETAIAFRITSAGRPASFDATAEERRTNFFAGQVDVRRAQHVTLYDVDVVSVLKPHANIGGLSTIVQIGYLSGVDRLWDGVPVSQGVAGLDVGDEFFAFANYNQELKAFIVEPAAFFRVHDGQVQQQADRVMLPEQRIQKLDEISARLRQVDRDMVSELRRDFIGRTTDEISAAASQVLEEGQRKIEAERVRAQALPPGQPLTPDVVAVYRVVLADSHCGGGRLERSLLLHNEYGSPRWPYGPTREARIDQSALAQQVGVPIEHYLRFAAVVSEQSRLADNAGALLGATLVSAADLAAVRATSEFYRALRVRYPRASDILNLSPVVFDPAGANALVYCEGMREGNLVRLTRTNGAWTAVVWQQMWIS